MATMLESYQARKNAFDAGLQIAMPSPVQSWQQQETLYRIGVLEICQMFSKTAPRSADTSALLPHYQMMDACFQSLTQERRYGPVNNQDIQKQRETAYGSLLSVIQDYRKRFGSFAPATDEQYQKDIQSVIVTVIPVWIQFRNTYVEIK